MENKLKNISVISSDKVLKSEKFNDFYFNSINPTNECKYVYICLLYTSPSPRD